jgi:hypothetical protein
MSFVMAFVVGGLLCLIFQAAMMITKLHPPELLIIGLFVGAVLTVFGISDLLAAWGGAGFSVMVIGASQAISAAFVALLHGEMLPALVVLSIFGALTLLGIIAGVIRTSIEKGKA